MKTSIGILSAGAIALVGAAAAAQRQRLPAECRAEIIELCRGSEGGLRRCISTALPKLSEPCVTAINERQAQELPGVREYAYGDDARQRLDLIVPGGSAAKRPLLLFVHGGGWSIGDKRHAVAPKARHFNSRGWAFGSVNYRLVPAATVEQQAADIAEAIAYVRRRAAELGIDGDRIVLMGHSAGAHLAALVGTDPKHLSAARVPLGAVDGIVLLDGAGYDVAKQMAFKGNRVSGVYEAAFGRDPVRQKALSPTLHAAAPNVAHWLIFPVSSRPDSTGQSNALAAALNASGSKATVAPVDGESHASLNRGFGEAGDVATGLVDDFLAKLP